MIPKIKILIFIFVILFFKLACVEKNSISSKKFIEQFGNKTFDQFKNRAFFIRDFDNEGDPIVFVFDETKHYRPCDMFLGITVDKDKQIVKRVNNDYLPDSCKINVHLSSKLAIQFYNYNINYLKVDSNENVFVNIHFKEESPTLIRFSNLKYKTDKYIEWNQVTENWYERPKAGASVP